MSAAAAFGAGLLLGAAIATAAARALLLSRAGLYGRLFTFALHELNTPVTAVNMTVMNLLEGVFGELPAAHRPWIEMTREQISRLNALVGEIRDLINLELQKELPYNVVDAAPSELAVEALAALRRGFALAGVELQVDVPEDLPAVRADSERAARSLTSLLFHARKFRKGGPVALTARRSEKTVAFTVAYDGPVLAPGETQASMELFYPARPRKDHQLAATGLGLGLIRAVMAPLGGTLAYDADAAGRAQLTLRLPAAS